MVALVMGENFTRTLFAKNVRHKAMYGGRGSGKTWSIGSYLVYTANTERKRIICARQFQNSIRDSSKDLIERRIRDFELDREFSLTDRAITHRKTGSEFLFIGLERNIESIRSLEGADIVWIDEARTISNRSMEILLPTVRAPGSQLIWSWNPEDPLDPVDAYFRAGKPPPNSVITFVDYHDNPYFKHTTLPHEMEVLKRGNFNRYRHVWLGEYDLSYDSKVFSNIRVGRIDVPYAVPPLYGMDFGFGKDPSFVVKCYHLEKTKQIFIAAEATGRVALDMLPAMLRTVIADDGDLVKADASQPGTIEFLQARGFNIHAAQKGPGSVKSGINFLQGYEIVIDPNCEAMREEARLYSWMTDKLTGRVLSAPVDAYNHGWDAVRYATESAQVESAMEGDNSGGVMSLKIW
jgi:phage terminase large subunit